MLLEQPDHNIRLGQESWIEIELSQNSGIVGLLHRLETFGQQKQIVAGIHDGSCKLEKRLIYQA